MTFLDELKLQHAEAVRLGDHIKARALEQRLAFHELLALDQELAELELIDDMD